MKFRFTPFNPVSLPMDWITTHPKPALLICGILLVLVLVHCERGFRRVTLPPLEPDGAVSSWYSKSWL